MGWQLINTMHKPTLISHLLAYYFRFGLIKDVQAVTIAVFALPVNRLKGDLYTITRN